MKVVFDTNVYISAFLVPGGQGEEAFRLAHLGRFDLCTSVPILTETANVLRTKFHQPEQDIQVVLKLISRTAHILRPTIKVSALRDLPDNRVLECAVAAQADLLVTGDRHMLKLKEFQEIRIVRLADLLRMFPSDA